MMFKVLLFFSFFVPSAVFAEASVSTRNLKLYEIGKTDGPLLYHQKIQKQKMPDGKVSTKTVATDPKGVVVFTETIISKGSMPLFQSNDVYQTKRHLELEVKGDSVFLRTRGLNAENQEVPKEDKEPLPANFISGALAEDYIVEHLEELMAGETIYAKMGIMELREMVNFKFWKKEMTKKNGREVIEVVMKPSSIFIALIVDPIHLFIDVKDKKMVHYIGRTPLWKFVNGKIKALDAEIVFD